MFFATSSGSFDLSHVSHLESCMNSDHPIELERHGSPLLRMVVRTIFALTSRDRAISQAKHHLENYTRLASGLSCEAGACSVEVPPMRGIDDDMRRWSFYMVLQHNSIVNRSITAIVQQLVRGEKLSGAALMDPRKDVMPAPSAGVEQIQEFQASVKDNVEMVTALGRLRGTKTAPHPILGNFDAHKWSCMFSFHLGLHYKQVEHVVRSTREK